MPIFQDDLEEHGSIPSFEPNYSEPEPDPEPILVASPASRLRRLSEESLRTELCEGPIPDSPRRPSTPSSEAESLTSSRAELIERLKRAQSPTWTSDRPTRIQDLDRSILASKVDGRRQLESILQHDKSPRAGKTSRASSQSPGLLPSAQITPEKKDRPLASPVDERLRDGLNIQRPRSALHSGDFTQAEARAAEDRRSSQLSQLSDLDMREIDERMPTSTRWIATSPPRDFAHFQFEKRIPRPSAGHSALRSVASSLSSSISASFAYQPPTSPLVQSESNEEELDLSGPLHRVDFSADEFGSRRHTLNSYTSSPFESPSSRSSLFRTPLLRREATFPYQAHQPRRSLTSTPSFVQSAFSPQTPALLRSRRPSLGSESSPIQHASMVGSYEESILRGRMSTTPSKPFDFLAQIGVLGKGKCKASLRCPAHVTLPFPAVYYSYSSTAQSRSQSDDGPSPYVGQVDLENGLPNPEGENRSKRKAQTRHPEKRTGDDHMDIAMPGTDSDVEHHRPARPKRRSGSPKAPPGGSYRIPEKGQIQIIIKNQNKTAVKLFLVPYDLTGMEPGTKTFIRQRSYSAGPIIDEALSTGSTDRPILRYLVHLHICCPARGRFYLYKSIRIVFANRVPDGKEKLRNETTWPEPRFTPYKPIRVMHPPLTSSGGPGAMLAADKAFRRRSLGYSIGGAPLRTFDMPDAIHSPDRPMMEHSSGFGAGNTLLIEPIPFHLPARDRADSDDISDSTSNTGAALRSPGSSQASRPSTKDSSGMGPWGATQYEKLNKGDFGYGGNTFGISTTGVQPGTESLLSQKLRSLGVKPHQSGAQEEPS